MKIEIGERKGTEINIVLGDVALEGLKDDCDENDKITAHFKYVEMVLRSSELTEDNQERERNLLNLQRYYDKGVYPLGEHSTEDVGRRKPNFCDSLGNLCGVGYLIQNTPYGGEELIKLITQSYQFSYIKDMNLPELSAWQEKSGLTLAELEIIQPSYEYQYVNSAKMTLKRLTELVEAAPGSEAEKACIKEVQRYSRLMLFFEYYPRLAHDARDLMEDLKEWESKHWGKKKFADENFVKLKGVIDSWLPEGERQASTKKGDESLDQGMKGRKEDSKQTPLIEEDSKVNFKHESSKFWIFGKVRRCCFFL